MTASIQKDHRPIRVLLVEDDLGDSALTFEAFKGIGTPSELSRARDGEEAMRYLRKEGEFSGVALPDLILLDLNMPKKSGLEVLQEIKNDPGLQEIPVLVLTSSNAEVDILRAYEAKANFFIMKPPDLDRFHGLIRFLEEFWLKRIDPKRDQVGPFPGPRDRTDPLPSPEQGPRPDQHL